MFAQLSEHPVHRVGAVLVARRRIHSGGFNKNRSHPRSPHEFCIHAEVDVLLRDRYPMPGGYKMYVARLTRGERFGTSKPCLKCLVYMKETGSVYSVTFVDEEGKIKTEAI